MLCVIEGHHTAHIPPVNGRLLLQRRHPSSASHPEPVIDALSMVLFTQLHSVSSIVTQQRWVAAARNSPTPLKKENAKSFNCPYVLQTKSHKRVKTIDTRKTGSFSSPTGHLDKNWDKDVDRR